MDFRVSKRFSSGQEAVKSIWIPHEILSLFTQFAVQRLKMPLMDDEEVLEDLVSIVDVQSLRLVNRAFNEAATPFLLQTVRLQPLFPITGRVTCIAQHPVFSKYVQTLVVDSPLFMECIANHPEHYAAAFDSNCAEAKLRNGYKQYRKLAQRQKDCHKQNLHLHAFAEALTNMPNLRNVIFSTIGRSMSTQNKGALIRQCIGDDETFDCELDHLREPETYMHALTMDMQDFHQSLMSVLFNSYVSTLSKLDAVRRIQSLKVTFEMINLPLIWPNLFGSREQYQNALKAIMNGLDTLDLTVRQPYRSRRPQAPHIHSRYEGGRMSWFIFMHECVMEAKRVRSLTLSWPTLCMAATVNWYCKVLGTTKSFKTD